MKNRYLYSILFVVLLSLGIPTLAGAPSLHLQVEGGDLWVCDSNSNGVVDATDTHLQGQFWFNFLETTEFDDSGALVKFIWMWSFHGTVTNLNTGELVFNDRFAGREILDLTTDTYSQAGATRHFFRPGEGSVYHDAGRITVNLLTGEVIEESGPHPLLNAPPTFCDLIDAGEQIFWEPQPLTINALGPG